MKIYYPKSSTWEIDYFTVDLQLDLVYYDNHLPSSIEKDAILVINNTRIIQVEEVIKLNPLALVILSDERLEYKQFGEIKIFRQYASPEKPFIQIPCTYAKTMLGGKPSTELKVKKIKEREYDFSFIGMLKSDRIEMCEKFSKEFKKGVIKHGFNSWNIQAQVVSPPDMFGIYSNSVFVPIGKGNHLLDCSRLCEAIIAGAIPVLVGSEHEIETTFDFNGHLPPFIYSDTWDNAIIKCKQLSTDNLQQLQHKLIEWWKIHVSFIKNEFAKLLKPIYPIKSYVINLKRRADRLQKFQEICPYLVEIVYGFDGKNPHLENKKERTIFDRFSRLAPGERGCWISHLRIWKKMIDQNIQTAMIFEDDALFDEEFVNIMEKIIIPQDGILYIGGRFNKNFTMKPEYTFPVSTYVCKSNFNNFFNKVHERTTHGYIIHLKVAKLFIEIFNNKENNQQLDHFMIQSLKGLDIPVYSTIPLLCHSPKVGDSDIR